MGRIFALLAWEADPLEISLKCDPEHAQALRAIYASVRPGYHLNKEHWNTITLEGDVPGEELLQMIEDSYKLIISGLKRTDRDKMDCLLADE